MYNNFFPYKRFKRHIGNLPISSRQNMQLGSVIPGVRDRWLKYHVPDFHGQQTCNKIDLCMPINIVKNSSLAKKPVTAKHKHFRSNKSFYLPQKRLN